MIHSNPFERVRFSTAQVMRGARWVHLNLEQLRTVAASWQPTEITRYYTYAEPYHFQEEGEQLLNYVMTLDALNFGSGFEAAWKRIRKLIDDDIYKTVATSLRIAVEQGNPLDAAWASSVQPDQVATLFALPADFPLVPMFVKSLNELGRWVLATYDGRYSHLIEQTKMAEDFVNALVTHLSCFRDEAIYHGEPVYFYKRAQILVNDLHLAFHNQSYGAFSVAHLTMFADNLVPHYLHKLGILSYNLSLEQRIAQKVPLEPGSEEEVELRAGAVQSIELACRLLPHEYAIFPAQLDSFLWNTAQEHVHASQSHQTITYFY